MNAFIYAADIYCEDCGNAIRADFDKAGKRPADPSCETTYDSDQYPKGPYGDGGGEADTPQHCAGCNCHLENPLTPDGREYVLCCFHDDRDWRDGAPCEPGTTLYQWQHAYPDIWAEFLAVYESEAA